MSDDHVYLSLAEEHEDDTRWAYGTGFEDPLHGVDTTVPDGVDRAELAALCLALGDDALVSAQRLAEWTTRAPELEEEVALANIGLDLLGQARLLYARTGQVDGTGRTEDAYAYLRDPADFRNVTLAELPGGDFAFSIARLLVLASWRLAHFERLTASPDPVLAAVAAKGAKELTYHRQYAAEWTVRLGDGTDESHRRMRAGLQQVVPYLGELFSACDVRDEVVAVLRQVTDAAGLPLPAWQPLPRAGRTGAHTEHLAPLLAELQSVARAHPGASW
ncbi:1,2-phenylacetyl-CoA epoxidase subunit PaaC [Streptomyces griseoviridis]|jgi:ring-1,2-phenylacetyl-CoA epoxidase subunit PaaC|uniref:Phenylacetate-CoA oxygenase subunit PaaI n=3 Tax=Streptomyces TaxID=1883 RepID=A0A918GMD3_STRGD|nr:MULTISPECIES: 1,2-phenylacetyl-CoA epoxidase subunit PaaC [Streptomyces]MDP9686084.1 ring-1,2-phenylacetyl-CoA epoxidase subunit PaaC [Streptomyces griseoviridis]GGS46493.1 phenylacetate-CoA oxygenase subunit PaaI [Streptomyces niveoruber]GGS79260.1 phenylacetate-CoA oxygenase subunit PaaI [Streptomyces griseoviridis]GGU16661.1 phenylacetate-CoA oxygenase subunit PaaI [Streptomyces daghestanicus]GHI35370.1 phenylacetate-CoA oxygenase subunit PaaI [Streptomyces daghestanicus]